MTLQDNQNDENYQPERGGLNFLKEVRKCQDQVLFLWEKRRDEK